MSADAFAGVDFSRIRMMHSCVTMGVVCCKRLAVGVSEAHGVRSQRLRVILSERDATRGLQTRVQEDEDFKLEKRKF